MIDYKTVFYLINITLIIIIPIWFLWINNRHKYIKGDPIMSPPYKKTLYFNKKIISNYNYNPFFDKIENNLKENQTISHYKWIIYYNTKDHSFKKAELVCFFKIGSKKTIFNFDSNIIFYKDKKNILHLSIDLILARVEENILCGEIIKFRNILPKKNSDFEEILNNEKEFIGYNIKTGNLRYEIKKI